MYSPTPTLGRGVRSYPMAGDRISPSLAGLVERDDLIAEIVEQQARVVTRGGCLVWLSGEAGVGKTSVVRAVAGRLRTRILTGACDAMTTPRPLGPLLDMAPPEVTASPKRWRPTQVDTVCSRRRSVSSVRPRSW